MKIKSIAAICKKSKRVVLFNKYNDDGEVTAQYIFKTITVDNGGEFADVEGLERSALRKGNRTTVYYCHPYSSYERGSNENQNRMIRRRHPKGTDFAEVTAAEVKETEETSEKSV